MPSVRGDELRSASNSRSTHCQLSSREALAALTAAPLATHQTAEHRYRQLIQKLQPRARAEHALAPALPRRQRLLQSSNRARPNRVHHRYPPVHHSLPLYIRAARPIYTATYRQREHATRHQRSRAPYPSVIRALPHAHHHSTAQQQQTLTPPATYAPEAAETPISAARPAAASIESACFTVAFPNTSASYSSASTLPRAAISPRTAIPIPADLRGDLYVREHRRGDSGLLRPNRDRGHVLESHVPAEACLSASPRASSGCCDLRLPRQHVEDLLLLVEVADMRPE